MVVNGTTEADWATVRQLAKDLSFVLPSYGLHPWYLAQRSAFWAETLGDYIELVDSFVERGAFFSFSGYFLNENKKAKLAPFHEIPMDRLLVEADAPAMPLPAERNEFPLPRREDGGSPNHPANIRAIYRGFVQIRQLSEQELLDAVRRNFDRLFQSFIDSA